jgi:hypothetical protein
MIPALLQVVLSSIAGFGIYRLWRRIAASSQTVFWLVTAGLLLRAVGGVLAFWISYLGLPIARSLQMGRGLWVFAIDAVLYVQYALSYAAGGLSSILLVDRTLPAPFFIQTLAATMFLFGGVISVAILLNLAAYLGCCAIVLSFGDVTRRPVVFAIAALSLSPSAIVWSLQALKDVTFLFLVMAFFGAARVWQQLWNGAASRRLVVQGVVWSAVLAALLYGISGIRWYFGAVILIASVPFAVMTIIGARARVTAAAASLLLLPLSFAAFFAAAGPYVPASIRNAVRTHNVKEQAAVPKMVLKTMTESRRGFDNAGGATIIGAGVAIRKIDAALAAPPPPPAKVVKHRVAARPKHIAAPPPKAVAVADPPPSASPSRNAAPQPPPATAVAVPAAPPQNVVPQLPPTTAVSVPVSPIARILAGTAAIVLPHSLAQHLGIVDVRGGRGFWLFVEVDTIVFDIVLLFAFVSIAGAARRGTLSAPVFWMMLFVTGAIGVALVYTVSNFGTLFRHRDMLLVGLVLLPLAAAGPPARLEDVGA